MRPFRRPILWWPRMFMMGAFTFLLYDTMTYKLHRDDIQRIEHETNKPAKDLAEEELVDAMRRLGIQRLEVTSDDQHAISSRRPMAYCTHCGTKLTTQAAYCPHCGKHQ